VEDEPEGRLPWLSRKRPIGCCRPPAGARNPDLPDLVELSLFTGLRQAEALELTWDRVDRSPGVLLLAVTKSGRRRQVPLNEAADAVLARRRPRADLRWHDLRHTFASWAVQRRVSLYELKELLRHSTLTMVKRYAHLAPEHLRAAAAALDGVLAAPKRDSKETASEGHRGPLIPRKLVGRHGLEPWTG
jgi:integrase